MISENPKKAGFISRLFGYAATTASNNRANISKNLVSVDNDLAPKDRDKAVSRLREHQKDFSIAGWGVRKHLDFVSEHTLSVKTSDKSLNKDLEAALSAQMEPAAFDIRGFHSLQSMTRLIEAHSTIEGDIFIQKLRNGQIQAIESDLVRTPNGVKNPEIYSHGCRLDPAGKPVSIAVHKRDGKNRFDFIGDVRYSNVFHHGNFQRVGQVRGVSPLMASCNDLQDVYENKAYGLAKSKLSQMFGLALYRSGADVDSEAPNPAKGPFILEMNGDDKAEFLSDKNPSKEWADFMTTVIAMALKSLDIPFSFYQENFTNFFGSKSALILYLKSCVSKRRSIKQRWLDPWTDWQLNFLKSTPEFRFLRDARNIPYKWISLGTPWSNPLQEVQASVMEIAMGMSSRARKVSEIYGEDVYEIIDEIKQEEDYMRAAGVEIVQPSTLIQRESPQNEN